MAASRRRRFGYWLALGAGLLLALELGLRCLQLVRHGDWAVPQWLRETRPPTTDWHPFLRRVPKPGTTWDVVEGDEHARIEIDSRGFRSPDVAVPKPEGTLRVACVGGSVVYDTRVTLAESWPQQLCERLRARLGVTAEVVNAGIPGRTSADSLVNVALRVLPLDPDVVIVLHGVNDQKPNRYPGFRDDYGHWYRPPRSEVVAFAHWLIDQSLLGSHLRFRFRRHLLPGYRDNARGVVIPRFDTVAEAGLAAYRRNLTSIVGVLRAHGVRPVLATAGHSLEGNADWRPSDGRNRLLFWHDGLTLAGIRDGFARYNAALREVGAAMGVPVVDVERGLAEGAENYQDDVHFTPAGARAAAALFADGLPWEEWVVERGVVEAESGKE